MKSLLLVVLLWTFLHVQGTTISLGPAEKTCLPNDVPKYAFNYVYFLNIPKDGGENLDDVLACFWTAMGLQNDNGDVDFTKVNDRYVAFVHISDLKPETSRPPTDNQIVLHAAAEKCKGNLPYTPEETPGQKARLSLKCFRDRILEQL